MAKDRTRAITIISRPGWVATVEGEQVRLSANGDVAVTFEEEAG